MGNRAGSASNPTVDRHVATIRNAIAKLEINDEVSRRRIYDTMFSVVERNVPVVPPEYVDRIRGSIQSAIEIVEASYRVPVAPITPVAPLPVASVATTPLADADVSIPEDAFEGVDFSDFVDSQPPTVPSVAGSTSVAERSETGEVEHVTLAPFQDEFGLQDELSIGDDRRVPQQRANERKGIVRNMMSRLGFGRTSNAVAVVAIAVASLGQPMEAQVASDTAVLTSSR